MNDINTAIGKDTPQANGDEISIEIDEEILDPYVTENWFEGKRGKVLTLNEQIEGNNLGWPSKLYHRLTFSLTGGIEKRLMENEAKEYREYQAEMLNKIASFGDEEYFRRLVCERLYSNSIDNIAAAEGGLINQLQGADKGELIKNVLTSQIDLDEVRDNFTTMPITRVHTDNFYDLRVDDPTLNWYIRGQHSTANIMSRIEGFVESISKLVSWSFVSTPGNIKTDLLNFIGEFRQLEGMDKKIKARERLCGKAIGEDPNASIFVPPTNTPTSEKRGEPNWYSITSSVCKTPRFANKKTEEYNGASYVQGGPLMNVFICSNLPTKEKFAAYWNMVYQAKVEFTVLLSRIGSFEENSINDSKYQTCYWPRKENETQNYGDIRVKNVGIDNLSDPVFGITTLEVSKNHGGPNDSWRLEIWHHDWENFDNINWPTRILRRARGSSKPTIIQCADGLGRSGTLILIECALMQLLRGPSMSNPIFTAATFLRLQRKHAVRHFMHYLFVYRVLINYVEPYVSLGTHRIILGATSLNIGFIKKFNKLSIHYKKKNFL
uniref:Tyrosine-protein phosphatase domain-containing protein n=1 Tax=Rhabditophanes sp. KR3021 TaxID=114890 RepID=A0AC35TGK5_9BILA